jgi:hypothetical protein
MDIWYGEQCQSEQSTITTFRAIILYITPYAKGTYIPRQVAPSVRSL